MVSDLGLHCCSGLSVPIHRAIIVYIIQQVAFWASPQDSNQVKAFVEVSTCRDNTWFTGLTVFSDGKVTDMRQVGELIFYFLFVND